MDDIQQQLTSILSNPKMMETIMSIASNLGQEAPQPSPPPEQLPPEKKAPAGLDPAMVGRLAALSGQGGIDRDQQALLKALTPFISRDRVVKLENAMRAAKLAKLASAFLNSGGLQLLTGR